MPSANRPVRGEQPDNSPLTAEIIESLQKKERTQKVIGLSSSKAFFRYDSGGVAAKTSYEKREERYSGISDEQKTANFKKVFIAQIARRSNQNDVVPAYSFHEKPVNRDQGIPLLTFPQRKYIHSLIKRNDPNQVEYSVDEMDIEYMENSNAMRMKVGNCPVSMAQFEFWIDRLERHCQFTPRKFQKLLGPNGEELDDVCNICLDGESANCNQIVFCDLCNLAVHQDCYGIPFLPESALACRRCAVSPGKLVSCELCPSKVGAFKQGKNGKWVHVLCVLWVDETIFANNIFMEDVKNVEKALHVRKGLSCSLCKDKKEARKGACIQCCEAKCTASFHVTCARNAGLTMRVGETADGVNRWVWCMKHMPAETEEDKEQKQMMMRNAKRENEKHDPISMPMISTVNLDKILLECPIGDYDELVAFWFTKRHIRYGAPLIKLLTPLTETKRRRNRERAPITTEMEKWFRMIRTSLVEGGNIINMTARREHRKKDSIVAHLKIFELGYKPVEFLCIQLIEKMKEKDDQSIFALPVDVEGYLKQIKHPMCLKTMTDKAARGAYSSVQLLQDDVDLMLKNCAQFNVGNKYFIEYGKKFGRLVKPILENGKKEDHERSLLDNDGGFASHVLNSLMTVYTGWATNDPPEFKVEEVTDVTDVVEVVEQVPETPTTGKRKGRRQAQLPPPPPQPILTVKVEEAEEEPQPPPSSGPGTTPRRPRSRRRGGAQNDEEQNPSTSAETPKSTTSGNKRAAGSDGISPRLCDQESTDVLRKRINSFGEIKSPVAKKIKKVEVGKSPSTLRQTSLISFFSTTPKAPTFTELARNADGSGPSTSIFGTTAATPTIATRSSTRTPSTRNTFRGSSSTLLSPLPVPRKLGSRAMDSTDEEEEIQLMPPPRQLTPEELEAERLRCAENEANSKFAHHQIVVVEGRAARVVVPQFAHLSDMHVEQRHQMMLKRREREVLGVMSKQQDEFIAVEFFQKSNSEQVKYVRAEDVELLDVDVDTAPKIVGFKAAKDWSQKVKKGTAT